jgi:hypothetical protein
MRHDNPAFYHSGAIRDRPDRRLTLKGQMTNSKGMSI